MVLGYERDVRIGFEVRDIDFFSDLMIRTIKLECLELVCNKEKS